MPILGMNYTRISAEKKKPVTANMKINTGPRITNIKKSKLQGFEKDVDVISVEFKFTSELEPEIGNIEIDGVMIYKADNTKEILDMWKDKNTIPEENQVELMNHLFKKTGILALQLSDILQFPPIISMPIVSLAKPPKKEK